MQPTSTTEEIKAMVEALPNEAKIEIQRHTGLLRRYLELGGPLSLVAFMLVSAELVEADINNIAQQLGVEPE